VENSKQLTVSLVHYTGLHYAGAQVSMPRRKYLRTDLEVKQADEPFVDFVKIAEGLSPIVCANRHSSLVQRFVDRCLATNGANEVAIARHACFSGILVAMFLCTAAFPGNYLREMKAMNLLMRNFLRQFKGLWVW
jgi:hypothetical protein